MAVAEVSTPALTVAAVIPDIALRAGLGAALLAAIGLLLLVPLYRAQRRDIARLLEWQEREPERGDERVPAPQPAPATGPMTPAERVTAERPALSRITAERAALESPSFWRRLIARGPRHPLWISALAVLVAAATFAAVVLILDLGIGDDGERDRFDRAAVDVVVLNGSSVPALADRVADDVAAGEFTVAETGVAEGSERTVVMFAPGSKRAGNAVARQLGAGSAMPFDRQARTEAGDAEVVVIAGEDRAKA